MRGLVIIRRWELCGLPRFGFSEKFSDNSFATAGAGLVFVPWMWSASIVRFCRRACFPDFAAAFVSGHASNELREGFDRPAAGCRLAECGDKCGDKAREIGVHTLV